MPDPTKVKHDHAADGLKLMCRLNEDGALETIPGIFSLIPGRNTRAP